MSSFFPITTLSADEADQYAPVVAGLSEAEVGVLMTADTSRFIRESIGMTLGLSEQQLSGVSRLVAEIILGMTPSSRAAQRIMDAAHVELGIATEIIATIDSGLFAPKGLSLASYNSAPIEPTLRVSAAGKSGLRYESLDDLLADIEPMTSAQRTAFLNEAKEFNRIFVLQAYSQLKMGADASGRPMSFREQVAREASSFSEQDWIDLLRVDPDAADEPGAMDVFARTALGAAAQGRGPAERRELSLELAGTSAEMQALAASPSTGALTQRLVRSGVLPETHAVAVGRIVYFLCVGKLQPPQVAATLERIGLPPLSATTVAQEISRLLPAQAPAPISAPPPPEPIAAPVTRTVRPVPTPSGRNIIDLRAQ